MKQRIGVSFKDKWSWMVLICGLILSIVVSSQVHKSNETRIRQVVRESAAISIQSILARIELYQYGLRGARGAVMTAGENGITRDLFNRYSKTRDIDTEFPGARGFGFIRRVPVDAEMHFLHQARADDWPDFTIRELAPNPREKYVIQYIEPVERNKEAVGLDIASEINRRTAAESSMRSGEVRLTGPITLVQAAGQSQQSFLIMMPIYRSSKMPDSRRERERLAFGWSYAPLIMADVLADQRLNNEQVLLELSDETDPDNSVLFFFNGERGVVGLYPIEESVEVYGRMWKFSYSVTPLFIHQLRLPAPLYIAFFGCTIAVLIALLTGVINVNRASKRRLQAEQARIAAIVESSADGIIGKTLDSRVSSWNKGAERIFGYTSQEAIGKPFVDLVIPEQYQEEDSYILEHIRRGESIPYLETVRQRKDGSLVDVAVTVSPIYSDDHIVIGVSKTVRDISVQKAAEVQIHELNANLEKQVQERTTELLLARDQLISTTDQLLMATEVAELGIWTWELENDALEWNDKMYALYEQPRSLREQGLTYSHWESRVHPDDLTETVTQLNNAVAGVGKYAPIFRLNLPSGKTRFVMAGAYVERNEHGEAVKVTGINRDITAEHELEKGLRHAKEEADAASAAKSMFLANMSHEIRTPMNAVLGMLQLIRTTELSVRQDEYASNAQVAATSLLSLLNDILDYSKIDSGKMELDLHPFQIDELMRALAVVLSANLGQKQKYVELLFDIDPELPNFLRGDRLRLQQILINLAGNAVKFTEQGNVVIRLQQLHLAANIAHVRFSVKDTGIGISKAQQARIFEGFTQAEASTTRRYGGTGLGLVISKRLIHLMGGELKLQSEPGNGSCFWFDLEMQIEKDVPAVDETDCALRRDLNVLIVDDNAAALEILSNSLSEQGMTIYTARSGHDALTQFARYEAMDKDTHVVLMDYILPDRVGIEVARDIKNHARTGHVPVIIMVTAFGREDLLIAQEDEMVPFDGFITKPTTPRQLHELIGAALAGKSKSHDIRVMPQQSNRSLQGIHLLVVEDNEINRVVASELLKGEGALVDIACDGLDGVTKVLGGEFAYDLVLMDMQMPGIDGLEATRRIRADNRFDRLPIIAMTANVSLADQEDCLSAGMNAHLGKPLDLTKVIDTILLFTGRRGDQMMKDHGTLVNERNTVDSDEGDKSDDVQAEIVDVKTENINPDNIAMGNINTLTSSHAYSESEHESLDTIMKRFGGNETLYRSMVERFELDLEQTLQHLEQVIVARDWKSVLTNLHTLKGSAGTIGISALYLLMSDIEAQLKALAPDFEHDACLALSAGIVAQCRSVAVLELSRIQAALEQRGKSDYL